MPTVPIKPQVLADGGWEAKGYMLRVSRRGSITSSEPMRPPYRLAPGARVTSIIWRIDNQQPLPSGTSMAICLSGKCVILDGLAGRSDALAGVPGDNPLTLQINVNGRGEVYPAILLTHYQVLVNYHIEP
jgi:flagellar protein FlhE